MKVVQRKDVWASVSRALGVSDGDHDAVLRQALRRAVVALAPCPRAALKEFVGRPLERLLDPAILDDRLDAVLDDLLAFGDLLETTDDDSTALGRSVALRPAPPSFVRLGDDVVLIGVPGEQASALPLELATRVRHAGAARRLTAVPGEDLAALLRALGLQELPSGVWLRAPPAETSDAALKPWRDRLEASVAPSGALDDFEILDRARPPTFYLARWQRLNHNHAGVYVARRRHAFGGRVWSLVLVEGGAVQRLLDFDAVEGRYRACDLAWRVQAAIDAAAGQPQRFRLSRCAEGTRLDLFSPLPSYVERRLMVAGHKHPSMGALFAFTLPSDCIRSEVEALAASLWMAPHDDSDPVTP